MGPSPESIVCQALCPGVVRRVPGVGAAAPPFGAAPSIPPPVPRGSSRRSCRQLARARLRVLHAQAQLVRRRCWLTGGACRSAPPQPRSRRDARPAVHGRHVRLSAPACGAFAGRSWPAVAVGAPAPRLFGASQHSPPAESPAPFHAVPSRCARRSARRKPLRRLFGHCRPARPSATACCRIHRWQRPAEADGAPGTASLARAVRRRASPPPASATRRSSHRAWPPRSPERACVYRMRRAQLAGRG
jgi:hypothetical protein